MSNRALGEAGERAAAEFLVARGCRIVGRNVRLPQGEIDLIVQDGETIVFVEVKARRSTAFGRPAEAVTPAKQHRLARLALAWLARQPAWRESPIRFDVVTLFGHPGAWQAEHLKDAFRPG